VKSKESSDNGPKEKGKNRKKTVGRKERVEAGKRIWGGVTKGLRQVRRVRRGRGGKKKWGGEPGEKKGKKTEGNESEGRGG